MRILVVTTVHVPLDARIHHRQIRALLGDGVEVTYAAPWAATGTPSREALAGVRTLDLPRAAGRRRVRSLRAARRLILRIGAAHDLVLLHDPELVLAVVGRRRRLPPVVLDVHEDLARSLVDRPWIPRSVRPLVRRCGLALERWAERRLHLLLAEERYADRFRHPHPVVPNLPWLPEEPPPAGSEDRAVYLGRISVGRGAEELIRVGELLTEVGGPTLELIGTPDADVLPAIERAHARGVLRWHGFLPNEQALARVRGAVAGLSLLHDLPNYRTSMPTKVVEYLANGVPVVSTPLPEAARLVASTEGGQLVPFGDAEAAARAVLEYASDRELTARTGAAGRSGAAELSWDAAAPAFVAHLRQLAGRHR